MLALSGRERSCPSEPVRWPTTSLRPHPLNPPGELDPSEVEELTDSIVAHAAQGGILQPAARHAGWAVIAEQASTGLERLAGGQTSGGGRGHAARAGWPRRCALGPQACGTPRCRCPWQEGQAPVTVCGTTADPEVSMTLRYPQAA